MKKTAILLALIIFYTSSWGEEQLLNSSIRIEIKGSDFPVEVSVTYRINKGSQEKIPLKGLAIFGIRTSNVEVIFSNSSQKLILTSNNDPLMIGEIQIPDYLVNDSIITLRLKYQLIIPKSRTEQLEYILPVLFIDYLPLLAPADFFKANIFLPKNLSIVESFPAIPFKLSTAAGNTNNHSFTMQVIPSIIRLKLSESGASTFSLMNLIDAGLAAILLLSILLGWKKLMYNLK